MMRLSFALGMDGEMHPQKDRAPDVPRMTPPVFSVMVVLCLGLLCCASNRHLAGKWKEVGRSATIEFFENGTFRAVDNQGMAVSGKYSLRKDGSLRCEIPLDGGMEVIDLLITIRGDELAVTSSGSTGVEIYMRER